MSSLKGAAAGAHPPVVKIFLPGKPQSPDDFLNSKTLTELKQLATSHSLHKDSADASSSSQQSREALIEDLKVNLPDDVLPQEMQGTPKLLTKKPTDLAELRKIVVEFCRGYVIDDHQGCRMQLDDETIQIVDTNGNDVPKELFERTWMPKECHSFYVWHKDLKAHQISFGELDDLTPVVELIEAMTVSMTQELFFEELIDNANEATAGLEGRAVRITLDAQERDISIEDNGLGLELQQIVRMAKLGEHTDKTAQKYGTQLGHYGFGFNAAAWWYGPKFTIESRVKGNKSVHGLTCDKNELKRTKKWRAQTYMRQAYPNEPANFTRVKVEEVPEAKLKQFRELNGFDTAKKHPMLLQKLADVYYMHLVDPVPKWLEDVDKAASNHMIPLKIFFEVHDRKCVMNLHFNADGVANFELHGEDFCGKTNAMHRITNPFKPEGKQNMPLHLSFKYANTGYNETHSGIQSSTSSKEESIRMDLVFFYHPSASGAETNPRTSEGDFPTTKTDHGLVVHWPTQGRMLPEGELPNNKWHLEKSGLRDQPGHNRFPFMEPDALFGKRSWNIVTNDDVSIKSFNRVRGVAFFSKGVPATEHKVRLLDAEGFMLELPSYFAERKLQNTSAQEYKHILEFRQQLANWSKLDVDYIMIEDESISRKDCVKEREEVNLNKNLGHQEQPWNYTKIKMGKRTLFPKMKVGGVTISSKWELGTIMTKPVGDLVKIRLRTKEKQSSKVEYGYLEALFQELEGQSSKNGCGMLWKQFTFREEEVKKIYLNDIMSIEKLSPNSEELRAYVRGQEAKLKAVKLEFSDRCVVDQKKGKLKAKQTCSTNMEGTITVEVEAFASYCNAAGRQKTKLEPLQDPFLGAKLEITYRRPGGAPSILDCGGILYPQSYGYQWQISSDTFKEIGEYTISVKAQDHSDIKLEVGPPAKLSIMPGLPTVATAAWAGVSGSKSTEDTKFIRLDDKFPSILITFKDSRGNQVSCPPHAKDEVNIECTSNDVAFALKSKQTKHEGTHLLISAQSLELSQGNLRAVTQIEICVRISIREQLLVARLKAMVTTSRPEKMVLVWGKGQPKVSTVEPDVGLPTLCLQLQDKHGRPCLLCSSKTPFAKYIVKLNGVPVQRDGKVVPPAKVLSGQFNKQGDLHIERLLDKDNDDQQSPTISLMNVPYGATQCSVQFSAFKASGELLCSSLGQPIECTLEPFAVAARTLRLDEQRTKELYTGTVKFHDGRRGSYATCESNSSSGEQAALQQPSHLVTATSYDSTCSTQVATFSTLSGDQIKVFVYVAADANNVAEDMSRELTICYLDATRKPLPKHAHFGTESLRLDKGVACLTLNVKSESDALTTAYCTITCSQIAVTTLGHELQLRLDIQPPKEAPRKLQIKNLSTVTDGLLVPSFDVIVCDFEDKPTSKSASGTDLEVRVERSPLSLGAMDGDSCVLEGIVKADVKADGVATFASLILHRPVGLSQPEMHTQDYQASISFRLHRKQPFQLLESVDVVNFNVTIRPNLTASRMELWSSTEDHKMVKISDKEFELKARAGEQIHGLQVLVKNCTDPPIELTKLEPPRKFVLRCYEANAPTQTRNSLISWVDSNELDLELPALHVPLTAATRHLTLSLIDGDVSLDIKLLLIVQPNLSDLSKLFWCISSKPEFTASSNSEIPAHVVLKMRESWRPKVRVQVEDAYGNKAELSDVPFTISEEAVQLQETTATQHLTDDFFTGEVRTTMVEAVTCTSYGRPAPRKSKHDALELKLVAGNPHDLQVEPTAVSLRHCSSLPEFLVSVRDADGNLCTEACGHAMLEIEQQFKNLLSRRRLLKPVKSKLNDGQRTLTPGWTLCLKEGFFTDDSSSREVADKGDAPNGSGDCVLPEVGKLLAKVTVTGRESTVLGPKEVEVTITRGTHPARLSVSSGGHQVRVVGRENLELDDVAIKVIAEDGSELPADELLSGRASLKLGDALMMRNPSVKEGMLVFTQPRLRNVARRLEQAGELCGEVCLEATSGMPLITSACVSVMLKAAEASQLVHSGQSLPEVIDYSKPSVVQSGATFEVQDAFGNPTSLPKDSKLTLKSSFQDEDTTSMQGLQDVVIDGSHAVLKQNIVMITTGPHMAKSGTYQLLLQVGNFVQLKHDFYYSQDALDDKTKELNEQLRKAQEDRTKIEENLRSSQEGIERAQNELEVLAHGIQTKLNTKKQSEEKSKELQRLQEQAQRLVGPKNRRKEHACQHCNHVYQTLDRASFSAKGGLGLVAELGAVESEDVAKVLGVALGSQLLHVVVQSNDTIKWLEAQKLSPTPFKAIALSDKRWAQNHFKSQVGPSPQCLLKLPSRIVPAYSNANGCLGYLVNLIVLEPKNAKKLRTQLWWPLLGDALLFMTKDQMRSWKEEYPEQRNRLLSVDGGDDSSLGMQSFAPSPEPCNFLKGVGEEGSPVDPRLAKYRRAKIDFDANKNQVQHLAYSIQQDEGQQPSLKQLACEAQKRKMQQMEAKDQQAKKIDKLVEELLHLNTLAGRQKANATPSSDEHPSSKRRISSPAPSRAVAEDTPAVASTSRKRKATSQVSYLEVD